MLRLLPRRGFGIRVFKLPHGRSSRLATDVPPMDDGPKASSVGWRADMEPVCSAPPPRNRQQQADFNFYDRRRRHTLLRKAHMALGLRFALRVALPLFFLLSRVFEYFCQLVARRLQTSRFCALDQQGVCVLTRLSIIHMSVTSIRTVGEWLSQSHVIDPLSLLPRYPQFGQAPTICVTLAVFSLYERVDIYITLMFTLTSVAGKSTRVKINATNSAGMSQVHQVGRWSTLPTMYMPWKKNPRYRTAMAYSLAILLDRPFKRIRLEFMLVH